MTENPASDVSRAPGEMTLPPPVQVPKQKRSLVGGIAEVEHPTEEWMLSYSDMVTLLLAMFVALLLNADFTKTVHGGVNDGGGTTQANAPQGNSTAASGGHGAGDKGLSGDGNDKAELGMRGTLQQWFHLNVTSPYVEEKGYVLALNGPSGSSALPQDADLAVIKDQDLAQIAFREQTLAAIRQKLTAAGISQYVTAEVEGDGIRLHIPNTILFTLGSADFASEGVGVIRAIVPIIAGGNYTISVEGHTDNVPIHTEKFPSNWELSAQRAAVIVRIMAEAGIAPKRLEAVGLADTLPLVTNGTPEGRAQNRRVTLFLRL